MQRMDRLTDGGRLNRKVGFDGGTTSGMDKMGRCIMYWWEGKDRV